MAFKRLLALAVFEAPYFDAPVLRCRGQLVRVYGVEGDSSDVVAAIWRMSVTHTTTSYALSPLTTR